MPETGRPHPPLRILAEHDVAGFIDAVAPHEVRCLLGLGEAGLADQLALAPPRRPTLWLDLAGACDAAACIERAVATLAREVAALWPYLWDGENLSELRDDALTFAHLPLRLAALASRHPDLSRAWAVEIVPRLLRNRQPRLAEPSPAVEWRQLALALAPGGLVLATPWRDGSDGAAFVAAIEWLARHAPVCVLVLAPDWPQATTFERLLFGAVKISPVGDAVALVAFARERTPGSPEVPAVIALPETEGRPHPQSAAELKLYTLIQADADLRPLFAFNRTVPDLPLLAAKADILWRDGRLVVEIDGPDHRGAVKYRADRHRDATLMLAGWRVLRLTNEDIVTDAAVALETIRQTVRLVLGEGR